MGSFHTCKGATGFLTSSVCSSRGLQRDDLLSAAEIIPRANATEKRTRLTVNETERWCIILKGGLWTESRVQEAQGVTLTSRVV